VGYAITEDSERGIHGQIVIVNNGPAPVSGWRITLVLPGDRGYQVLDARNRSAGDALVMTSQADGRSLAAGGTELIAFTAQGTTSSPVRSTFTAAPRPRPAARGGSGTAASRGSGGGGRAGDHRHEGRPFSWLGGWLNGGRTQRHWSQGHRSHGGWPQGGWPQGGWPQGGWPGRGGPGSGRAGHHHGWPGGR
jgi:Cellulose binding domain